MSVGEISALIGAITAALGAVLGILKWWKPSEKGEPKEGPGPAKVDPTGPIKEIELSGDLKFTEGTDAKEIGKVYHIVFRLQVQNTQIKGCMEWTLLEYPGHPRSGEIGKSFSDADFKGFLEGGENGAPTNLTLHRPRGKMLLIVRGSSFDGTCTEDVGKWKFAGVIHGSAALIR